jgi:hypothetical protein
MRWCWPASVSWSSARHLRRLLLLVDDHMVAAVFGGTGRGLRPKPAQLLRPAVRALATGRNDRRRLGRYDRQQTSHHTYTATLGIVVSACGGRMGPQRRFADADTATDATTSAPTWCFGARLCNFSPGRLQPDDQRNDVTAQYTRDERDGALSRCSSRQRCGTFACGSDASNVTLGYFETSNASYPPPDRLRRLVKSSPARPRWRRGRRNVLRFRFANSTLGGARNRFKFRRTSRRTMRIRNSTVDLPLKRS